MAHGRWAEVAETHSAAIFFAGDLAYKLKKPVDLGFLDFRTREAREAVCHEEVRLNRRLAPDVYLGVADVTDPAGRVCDHLVVMRRMPPERRLASLVVAGEDVDGDLWRLAHLLATFHAGAARSPAADEAASVAGTLRRWTDNTAEVVALVREHPAGVAGGGGDGGEGDGGGGDGGGGGVAPGGVGVTEEEVLGVQRLAERYLAGRGPLLDRRVAEGRACDGHGDLLADDIFCLDDGPRVLDCIEFDERLRIGDALADVAFLAMDLEHLGRPDLAERFLAAYREHADDTWPASLAHHQVAYRAQVRAKVSAIRAAQGVEAAAAEAASLLALCRRHLEAARVRLVVVGGLPGTGKSTLAAGLGDALGAPVLRSDEVRKELAGVPREAHEPTGFRQGLYRPEMTDATYEELLRRAGVALGLGETVVLDASWTDGGRRAQAAALAADAHADLVELCCTAPAEVAAARIRGRRAAERDPSDATPAVAAAMAAEAEPWPSAVVLGTDRGRDVVLAEAMALVRAS